MIDYKWLVELGYITPEEAEALAQGSADKESLAKRVAKKFIEEKHNEQNNEAEQRLQSNGR